jgi:hypothetical protein
MLAGFEQMSREGMAQRVWCGWTRNPCGARGVFDGALENGFVQMMSAALTGLGQVLIRL